MKYKHNRKIEQINESTLIVGADIAKHKHFARAVDFRGIELGKAISFSQSQLYTSIQDVSVLNACFIFQTGSKREIKRENINLLREEYFYV